MITDPKVEAYLHAHAPARDTVLGEMEARAKRERIPIVGPLVGILLFQLLSAIRARRVFELGSAIGYSTIWLARAVGPKGRVFYTEGNPDRVREAEGYLRRAKVRDRVTLLAGDALTGFRATPGVFDAVFNDVDKGGYPAVWKAAAPRIRSGGLYLCDNTLWSGTVADPRCKDPWTRAIRRMNAAVAGDRRYVASILPLRDGLTVAWRKP